jgi:hypothetical protein
MNCSNPSIPEYLHTNDKKTYSSHDFKWYHKYYRLKSRSNPLISINLPWINALSGKWSYLIKNKHICKIDKDRPEWNDFHFAYINDINNYVISTIDSNGKKHMVNCVMSHAKKPCDYSHCEILIRHRIYNPKGDKEFDSIYTSEDWTNKAALLRSIKEKKIKQLKKDYRIDMIKLIGRPSYHNNIFFLGWYMLLNLQTQITDNR